MASTSTTKRTFSLINDGKNSPNKLNKKKSKTDINVQSNNLLNYFMSNKKPEKTEVKTEDDQKENIFLNENIDNESNVKKESENNSNNKQVKNAFEIMKSSSQQLPSSAIKKSNSSLNIKEESYKEESESQTNNKVNRKCPFYKRIEGTQIVVDAFSYGDIENCNAYFLSHYHYDHFVGLTKHFKNKIFCSKVTANLVIKQLKVDKNLVNPLEMNKFNIIYPNDDSIQVALLDANQYYIYKLYLK